MNNITFDLCEIKKLMPEWMRNDKYDASLADSLSTESQSIGTSVKGLNPWVNIDSMTESQLDELAWEWNVAWYQYDESIAKKREIIKNARKVHRHLGTKWAIDEVLSIYFDASTVLEWYEYGGQPGHFKIQTINSSTVDEKAAKFLSVLDKIKRQSQHLDKIEVMDSSQLDIIYVILPRRVDINRTTIQE